MSALAKTLNAIYGAGILACFNEKGLRYLDHSKAGFWHSFQAAIWVFPLYVLVAYVRWINLEIDISGVRYFLIEMIAYVIAWVAFPLLLPYMARHLEREDKYYRTVTAYNWSAVIQNLFYTPVAILNLSGAGGAGLLTTLTLVAILAYTWFVAKTSLSLIGSKAWLVVGMDISISIGLSLWVNVLMSG